MSDELRMPPVIDLEVLLQPISEENPSGESLRYSGIYDEIAEARRADDDLNQGEWKTDHLNAKIFNVRLERGDAYKMLSGGGGGFGDPLERDVEKVAEDVREGYVSAEVARDVYRVALDSKGHVTHEVTRGLRSTPKVGRNGASPTVAWDGQ